MAKIDGVQEVALEALKPYEKNAKIHNAEQVERIAKSIKEFGFISPCLIDKDFNIIAGHGRVKAAQQLGLSTVPCVFIEGLTETQRKAYIIADNRLTELGEWDDLMLNQELRELYDNDFEIDLTGFDLPENAEWFQQREKWDNSREEGNDEYNEFLDKFEQAKTTDDCYTPENIYEVIRNYVAEEYNVSRANFMRPFYPGGDYQREKYQPGCVVVDNPPFSLLREIVDFYVSKNIKFFLFCPGLVAFNYASRLVTVLCTDANITYENGATVRTSFLTNLGDVETIARTAPKLYKLVESQNDINLRAMRRKLPKYSFPDHLVTRAIMNRWSKYGIEQSFKRSRVKMTRELDAMKEAGKGIYGCGLLLSNKAAAEKAAAEKAAAEKAAAEKAAATQWKLSAREWEIVEELSHGE